MEIYRLLKAFLFVSVLAIAKGACKNCVTCQGNITCSLCNDGYYTSNGICKPCQDNCENCKIDSSCSQCFVGFYLDNKIGSCHPCISGCKSCDSIEVCRSCVDRYFLQNDTCLICPTTCSTCLSSGCTSCYQGFWGSTNCTNKCPGGCKNSICDLHGYCLECSDGKYGTTCQYMCPDTCLNNKCSTTGDSCTDGCVLGFYGSTCDMSCPNNCNTNNCSKYGECTTGCKSGLYGRYCDKFCLLNTCPNNECFQNNGSCVSSCPESCVTCISLTSCTSCKQGQYGSMCENQCPDSNCKECTQEIGTCLICSDGHFLSGTVCMSCAMECQICEGPTSSNCLSCTKGYYLENNQCKSCNRDCLDCSMGDNCSECQAGYFLATSECIQCQSNCKTCISTNQCTACIDGYQGNTCDRFVCADQKYSSSYGADSCECDKQKCSNKNGNSCLACADVGWYPSGPGCCPCAAGTYENNSACVTCPEHCITQGQCNVSTGACVKRCEDRWWGSKCDQRCNDTCKSCSLNGTCDPCTVGIYTDTTCSFKTLPGKGDTNGSNTVIIAAAGGGGAVMLIIIIAVVIICVVRRKTTPKTRGKEQTGADEEETVYTDNAMYASLPETQTAAKAHTTQYDNRFSLEDEYSTTTMDTGHYSFVDKSESKTGRRLDSQRNRKDTSPSAANNSTNETSDIGHDSIVDKYRYEMAMGSDAVYSVPNKKSKVKQSENL